MSRRRAPRQLLRHIRKAQAAKKGVNVSYSEGEMVIQAAVVGLINRAESRRDIDGTSNNGGPPRRRLQADEG